MPPRNSLHAIEDLSDLTHLDEIVVDKRLGQRSAAKKNRRNRHVEKQFIRNSLTHHLQRGRTSAGESGHPVSDDDDHVGPSGSR